MELTQKRIIRSKIAFVFVVFGKYNNKIALFCPKIAFFFAKREINKKNHKFPMPTVRRRKGKKTTSAGNWVPHAWMNYWKNEL